MAANERITCEKCGRSLFAKDFYQLQTGNKLPICKTCLTSNLENDKPETFDWILKKFDVPYLPTVWAQMARDAFSKNPKKYGSNSVLGIYLRSMRMGQYKNYHYGDTEKYYKEHAPEFLEKDDESNKIFEIIQRQKELDERFAAGEISEHEYNTLSSASSAYLSNSDKAKEMTYVPGQEDIARFEQEDSAGIIDDAREKELLEQMSRDDINYLTMKWGATFKPSQWLRLEELYRSYETENELNTDREDAVRKICKTSVKMDEALAIDDFISYKNLSTVYDQLRKSAKLTEAQKVDRSGRDIDVAGQIVQFVERESDFIPNFPTLMAEQYPILMKEYTEDKIDFIIKDLENFTRNFIAEERGLGDMIEDFIKSYQEEGNKAKSVEELIAMGVEQPEEVEEDVEPLPQEQIDRLNDKIQEMLQKDAGKLMDIL